MYELASQLLNKCNQYLEHVANQMHFSYKKVHVNLAINLPIVITFIPLNDCICNALFVPAVANFS